MTSGKEDRVKKIVKVRITSPNEDPPYRDSVVLRISTDGGKTWDFYRAYMTHSFGGTVGVSVGVLNELRFLAQNGYELQLEGNARVFASEEVEQ